MKTCMVNHHMGIATFQCYLRIVALILISCAFSGCANVRINPAVDYKTTYSTMNIPKAVETLQHNFNKTDRSDGIISINRRPGNLFLQKSFVRVSPTSFQLLLYKLGKQVDRYSLGVYETYLVYENCLKKWTSPSIEFAKYLYFR